MKISAINFSNHITTPRSEFAFRPSFEAKRKDSFGFSVQDKGEILSEKFPARKLSTLDKAIVQDKTAGKTYAVIAESFGISASSCVNKFNQAFMKLLSSSRELPDVLDAKVAIFKKKFMPNKPEKAVLNFLIENNLAGTVNQKGFFHKIDLHIFNVVKALEANGLTRQEYIKSLVQFPPLFSQKPETIIANVTAIANEFQTHGLSQDSYIKAVLKYPSLFSMRPETVAANINGVVNAFSDYGLTTADYLKSTLIQPSLLYQKPTTIVANITDVVSEFSKYGLTFEDYVKAATKKTSLFYQNPKTITRNIATVVEQFNKHGLTYESYLARAVGQPSLFCLKPETVFEKVDIYDFTKRVSLKRKGKTPAEFELVPSLLRKGLTYSNENMYSRLLNYLISYEFKTKLMPLPGIKNSIEEYFKSAPKGLIESLMQKYITEQGLGSHRAAEGFMKFVKKLAR